MQKIWNTIPHNPDQGQWGDCHRVCYAMLLGLQASEVPHFFKEGPESGKLGDERQTAFLLARGLARANFPYPGDMDREKLIRYLGDTCPDVPMIFGGKSNSGCDHSVVILNGEIHHDPSGSEIIGPCVDDGFYWLTIFSVVVPKT